MSAIVSKVEGLKTDGGSGGHILPGGIQLSFIGLTFDLFAFAGHLITVKNIDKPN